ncbi:hypothetical protein [Bradyrhizobium sp. 5.13L]
MQPLTINDLFCLTRDELCRLTAELEQTLGSFEAGTVARMNVLVSLDNIRRTMLQRGFHF